jgi:hypothetical protein
LSPPNNTIQAQATKSRIQRSQVAVKQEIILTINKGERRCTVEQNLKRIMHKKERRTCFGKKGAKEYERKI